MNEKSNPGASHPLGATLGKGGANFSLFSRSATRVELLFFDRADDAKPSRVLDLDPATYRTYHYWHALVPGVKAGQLYGYRVDGPSEPAKGMRFDPAKVLLDPTVAAWWCRPSTVALPPPKPGDNTATAMKSVVADSAAYDWEGDAPLHRPSTQTIIYEMHVRGFTRHPSSGVTESKRGTYAASSRKSLISRISVSPQSSCCRSFNSMPRTRLRPDPITGVRADFLLRSARRLQLTPGRLGPAERVS